MSQYVSGAVLQRIVLKDFRQIPMLVPPIGLQRAWAMEVTPMIRRCWRHLDESDVLESMRDAIIPSLISGRLTPNDAGPIGEATPL
jgi:type I restriction enzyme S subunit